jgi:hypothetical protein
LREQFPEDYPYPLYFEPGGLLPWGISEDGDYYYCWLTRGLPDKWPVITVPRHADVELFEMTMVKFIEGALLGEIESGAIPSYFSQRRSFIPTGEA